jgi:hypothetical protein
MTMTTLFVLFALVWVGLFVYLTFIRKTENKIAESIQDLKTKLRIPPTDEKPLIPILPEQLVVPLGVIAGAFIGFLLRPSIPIIEKQLPLGTVLLRGSNLTGLDQALIPLAEKSFNFVLAGAIIGLVVGFGTRFLVRLRTNTPPARGNA